MDFDGVIARRYTRASRFPFLADFLYPYVRSSRQSRGVNDMGLFGPKQNNKTIGERSEAIIIAKFLEVGYGVLTPFGDNRRYDLVIEGADGNFYRIQCKTGWVD